MRELTISIRPTLDDIRDPKRLVKLVKVIERALIDGVEQMLIKVGEKILNYAKANAERGYEGIPYGRGEKWEQRSDLTMFLYNLSPTHEIMSGLDTGRHQLIKSLERYDELNFFEIKGDVLTLGTDFEHAALLEKGGIRPPRLKHLGFSAEGIPAKWLIRALMDRYGLDEEAASQKAMMIYEELMTSTAEFSKRPFLGPALWYVQENEEHTKIVSRVFLEEVVVDVEMEMMSGRMEIAEARV